MGKPFVISFVATKGGPGKTTLAANLSALLATLGMRVLIIDADVQPSLSKYYQLAKRAPHGLTAVITRGGIIEADCISKTVRENLDIVVSDDENKNLQTWLKDREDRLIIMRRACQRSPYISENYDVIVIDTQGAVGELSKTAAMAADIMISPVNPTIISSREFASGTMKMLNSLNAMSDFSSDFGAGEMFALINQTDRSNDSKVIEEQIRRDFRNTRSVRVMETVVPTAAAYKTAATLQVPAFEIDRPSKRKANSAFETLHHIVWEIFPNLREIYYTDVCDEEPAA